MKIFVRSPSGQVQALEVDPHDTIQLVKETLFASSWNEAAGAFEAPEPDIQLLLLAGKKLDSTLTLQHYQVQKESTLQLLLIGSQSSNKPAGAATLQQQQQLASFWDSLPFGHQSQLLTVDTAQVIQLLQTVHRGEQWATPLQQAISELHQLQQQQPVARALPQLSGGPSISTQHWQSPLSAKPLRKVMQKHGDAFVECVAGLHKDLWDMQGRLQDAIKRLEWSLEAMRASRQLISSLAATKLEVHQAGGKKGTSSLTVAVGSEWDGLLKVHVSSTPVDH